MERASGIALAQITEISVNQMLNEPEKMEGKVITEITIIEGTLQNESLKGLVILIEEKQT